VNLIRISKKWLIVLLLLVLILVVWKLDGGGTPSGNPAASVGVLTHVPA